MVRVMTRVKEGVWLWETKVRRKMCSWEDSVIHGRAKDALDLSGKLNEDGTSLG